MLTLTELYNHLLEESIKTNMLPTELPEHDPYHLDCLLHPENYSVVWKSKKCECTIDSKPECVKSCMYDAIVLNENGYYEIDPKLCIGCSICIDACNHKNLMASRDTLPTLSAVRKANGPVYALIAPSFLGQFSSDVTPGKIRSAFKKLGFTGMIEVALFADMLTLKEALEFDRNILTESDYQLTSCCCPLWIAMIRKIYSELMPHVPGAVSPMIASGRAVKHLYPDALTIFIGPCIAKKAEAREADIAGAIDYVLTFQEMQDIFTFAQIDLAQEPESEKEHSSRTGRIYARAGGVSEAVQNTINRLNPNRKISVNTRFADGVVNCKAMINELKSGKANANFYEGMGCIGGCVGGPKVLIDTESGRRYSNEYGDKAAYSTPIDNTYVIKLLEKLGFDTVESLLDHSSIFTRKFD